MPRNFVDRTGQRYGKLLVIRRGEPTSSGASWECRCDCGAVCVATANNIRVGQTSCAACAIAARREDLTGQKFTRLTVIRPVPKTKGRVAWECLCDCGNVHFSSALHLKNGHTQSCGCLAKERSSEANTTHGLSGHPAYDVWVAMCQRCTNPNNPWFHRYGGRGIKVCERWQSSSAFLEDMLSTWAKGLTLDRIDNDGDYEPGNCRWVTQAEQMSNRARTIRAEVNGESLTVPELSQRYGVRSNTIRARLRAGKSGAALVAPT